MSTPGAVMSGLIALFVQRGPREENSASLSSRSTAPTVRAASADAGEPIGPPELPAATTNSAPLCSVIRSSASDIGSVPSSGHELPRLMLITRALVAAHSMPAMMSLSRPPPESPSTLPFTIFESGAMPLYLPSPVIVDATCVPWPKRSSVESLVLKFFDSTTAPARSGCVSSTPVSSTATVTSLPVKPFAHAWGAPTCAALRSSDAVTLPSSQILPVPAARTPVQKLPFLSTVRACALMLRNDSAVAALIPCPCTISGMVLLEASS